MQPRRLVCGLIEWGLLLALAPVAMALTPQQIAVVVNRSSLESVQVGQHYAQRRNIPDSQVIPLDLGPMQETISRHDYEQQLVQPLRQALEQRGLAGHIRTLVTVYGLPLIVQAPAQTAQERLWIKNAQERFTQALEALEALARGLGVAEGTAEAKRDMAQHATALLERLQTVMNERLGALHREPDLAKRAQASKDVTRLAERVGGQAALLQALQSVSGAVPEHVQAGIASLKNQIITVSAMVEALRATPSDATRQQAYRITEAMFGLQGVLRLATAEGESFQHKDSDASVDSELSLLWVDPRAYRLEGRSGNPLHYAHQAPTDPAAMEAALLMVSRLDAPTPALAMQLVDRAIATEQSGLEGKAYLDARGLKGPIAPLSTQAYDQSLRDLATLLRQVAPYPVTLDDTERTFSQPGDAPDVALYAGWYRYRAYEDAFTFLPGALGYHIASGEAVSIHNPQEKGWCKNALERGITATLGPTSEPYLDAFPLPHEFFGLLLTGKYTLVEAYYLTTRYVSWRMVLFGDPLYNPWRAKPLATLTDLTLQAPAGSTTPTLPLPPSERPFPEPHSLQQQWQQRQQALLAQVEVVLQELARREQAASPTPTPAPPTP